jgi:hypothetical protein
MTQDEVMTAVQQRLQQLLGEKDFIIASLQIQLSHAQQALAAYQQADAVKTSSDGVAMPPWTGTGGRRDAN